MPGYALFLGCMIPLRLPFMESSSRQLIKSFDVELVDLKGAACCPDPSLKSLDKDTWMTLAARNIASAEEMGLNILTLCNGCFETLKTVNVALKKDTKLKVKINESLTRIGKEYKGNIEVKHLVEVLINDIGVKRLSESVKTSLNGLRVATHYGCHLLRPGSILEVDDSLRPVYLDRLVELTGASSIPYYKANLCCGAGVSGVDADTAKELVKFKLRMVAKAKADCMAVVCPFCMLQYDVTQTLVTNEVGKKFDIPVLYYPEMMLLAMGLKPDDLALDMHRIKVDPIIEKIKGG
jgi:heterodisulfide reductase subunit B